MWPADSSAAPKGKGAKGKGRRARGRRKAEKESGKAGREGEGDQGCGRPSFIRDSPAPHVGTLGVDDAQGPIDLVESLGHGEADAKAGLKVPGASAVSNLPLLEQDS